MVIEDVNIRGSCEKGIPEFTVIFFNSYIQVYSYLKNKKFKKQINK